MSFSSPIIIGRTPVAPRAGRADRPQWGRRSALDRRSLLLTAVLAALTLAAPALGIISSYESFDYNTGSLNGRNGGTGDWKDSWSGDSGLQVQSPTSTYTDSSSNELEVDGNRVGKTGNSVLKSTRTLNNKVGESSETIWVSVIINGHSGNRIHNLSLGDGLFIGQGTKDSGTNRLGLSDADGLLQNSSTTPNNLHFLVVRVDFSGGGRERVALDRPRPRFGAIDGECRCKLLQRKGIRVRFRPDTASASKRHERR